MRYADVPLALQTGRVLSVDAVRGFSMFWIIGADGAVIALERMLRGKGPVLNSVGEFLGTQMTHAEWEGLRFYDFIFPLFIFITGVSIVLALPRLVEREGRTKAHLHVLRRALLLYVLGIIYYGGVGQQLSDIRFVGILQRIAVCYLFASILFLNLDWRGLLAAVVALLVGYWALLTFVPVPGLGTASYQPEINLANWVDVHFLPGRLWDETRDPEGLLSTLPAVVSTLLGVFTGEWLGKASGLQVPTHICQPQADVGHPGVVQGRVVQGMVVAGALCMGAGEFWGRWFPINKNLWTSSYVLFTGGFALAVLALCYWMVEIRGWKRWGAPFVWYGSNAITVYAASAALGVFSVRHYVRPGVTYKAWVYGNLFAPRARPMIASALYASAYVLTFLVLAWVMYRKKIFVKI
jgi:predicted acyltransferase